MWWNKIIEWFSNNRERNAFISDFNTAAKQAFISNVAPVFMKAESSIGNRAYKHQFSNFFYHGFRIRILTGMDLSDQEIKKIGDMIIANTTLTRQLVTLGYDTFEITNINGSVITDWRLTTLLELR